MSLASLDERLFRALGLSEDELRFGVYMEFVMSLSRDELSEVITKVLGRRLPPKRRREESGSRGYLIYRWLTPDRTLLEKLIDATMGDLARSTKGVGIEQLVGAGLQPLTLLVVASEHGLDPGAVVQEFDDEFRDLLETRKESVRRVHVEATVMREHNLGRTRESANKVAERLAAQRTREASITATRWRTKAVKAEQAIADIARREGEKRSELEAELYKRDAELAEVRALNKALQAECLELGAEVRFLRRRLAETATGVRQDGPLVGHVVLVVGDQGHAVDYKRVCLELGADEAAFVDGFGNPAAVRSRARMATLVVFVKAFASHTVWETVNSMGVDIVPVLAAGIDRFRRALLEWAGGRTA